MLSNSFLPPAFAQADPSARNILLEGHPSRLSRHLSLLFLCSLGDLEQGLSLFFVCTLLLALLSVCVGGPSSVPVFTTFNPKHNAYPSVHLVNTP